MQCPVCRMPIEAGQQVQRMPPPERAHLGQKSGILGVYPDKGFEGVEEDFVHYPHCCMEYFDPEGNPYIYDQRRDELEENLREEIREEFNEQFEQVKEFLGENNWNFCVNCWDSVQEEEPLMCIFCKRHECVMELKKLSGTVYYCMLCQRWWDENEQELRTAA